MVCLFPTTDFELCDINLGIGQFPGPLIETRSGDEIEVEIHNGLRDEGVAIHWHGLWMRGNILHLTDSYLCLI